jgi:hydrogenase accessory protein HypB
MISKALTHLPLTEIQLLFIENVGNLICPAGFALGANIAVVVASVPEGHDKPYKYPGMFASADIVLLNKIDLIDVFEFDVLDFRRGVGLVNPEVPIFPICCRTGEGVDAWTEWLVEHIHAD